MDISTLLIVAVGAYLIGSISFSRLVAKLMAPDVDLEAVDLEVPDSDEKIPLRNVSATTVSVKLGPRVGCLIGWLDIFKVALPTLALRLLYPDQPYFLVAAAMGMVGHNWPVFYKFRGGAGVSSIYGGFLVIDWLGALICSIAGFVLGLFVIKDVLVAYLAGVWLMIPWLWFRTHDPAHLLYALVVNAIFMVALIPEIQAQLKARREGKSDVTAGLQSFPMGRGMLKIMQKFGVHKG